jgi:hypothetical protein
MVNNPLAQPSLHYSQHLGSVPRIKTDLWRMIGQDGGQSIDLGEQTLFVFSDSLLAPAGRTPERAAQPIPFHIDPDVPTLFLANCAGITSGQGLRKSLARMIYLCDEDSYPKEILVTTPEERAGNIRFWPEHGIFIDGRIFLYYLGIQTLDPESIWGFKNLGIGLAVLDPKTGVSQRVLRDGDWRLWPIAADDFHFGVQVVRHDEYLFVFGSVRKGYNVHGILSRVPISSVTDLSAYTYKDDFDNWVPDFALAGSIGPTGPEYSVSYNPYLKKFLLVYIDPYHKDLFIRFADQVSGPYSPPKKIGRLPHHPESELIYMGFEHPKFSVEDGKRVYITYCQPFFSSNEIVELCFQ